VQDEREAFGGGQGVEHDEQRHADRVREHRFAFGIGPAPSLYARLADLRADRLFPSRLPRTQHVQAHA
jgi:hypothetical protein